MCCSLSRGVRGETHAHEGVPGYYFSPECFLGGVPTCAILGAVAEGGANARAGEAAEKRANVCPGTALEVGYPSGTAVDGFGRMKERSAELAATAEGSTRAGASTAARMRTLPGAWRLRAAPHSQ